MRELKKYTIDSLLAKYSERERKAFEKEICTALNIKAQMFRKYVRLEQFNNKIRLDDLKLQILAEMLDVKIDDIITKINTK